METLVTRTRLKNVPVLLAFNETPFKAGRKGTVLFYHGLYADKDKQSKELRSLAGEGFLAVGIDNVGHGERRYQDMEEWFEGPRDVADGNFIRAVSETVAEIPGLIDELVALGLARPDRIGVAGISMGGFIAFAAPLIDRRIKVCTPILGSPTWPCRDSLEPSGHPNPEYFPTALLVQNAGRDTSVSPDPAREFCKNLQSRYIPASERLRYVEFPNSGHFMDEADWAALWGNVLDWFHRFL